jgi:ribonuclease E
MKKEMLINVLQPEESRIAIVEDGVLEELYVERTGHENYTGNIYKGRIVNIEPAIQAAFVDFSVGRNGFLHVSDVEPQYYRRLMDDAEPPARDRSRAAPDEPRPARGRPREESRGPTQEAWSDRLPPPPALPPQIEDRSGDATRDAEPATDAGRGWGLDWDWERPGDAEPPRGEARPRDPNRPRDRGRERPDRSEKPRRGRRFGEGLTDDDWDEPPPPPPRRPVAPPEPPRGEPVPPPRAGGEGPTAEPEVSRGRSVPPPEPIEAELPPSRTARARRGRPIEPAPEAEAEPPARPWGAGLWDDEPAAPPVPREPARGRGRARPERTARPVAEPPIEPEPAPSGTPEVLAEAEPFEGPPRRGGRDAIRARSGDRPAGRAREPRRERPPTPEPAAEPEREAPAAPRGAGWGRGAASAEPPTRGRAHDRAGERGYVPRRERVRAVEPELEEEPPTELAPDLRDPLAFLDKPPTDAEPTAEGQAGDIRRRRRRRRRRGERPGEAAPDRGQERELEDLETLETEAPTRRARPRRRDEIESLLLGDEAEPPEYDAEEPGHALAEVEPGVPFEDEEIDPELEEEIRREAEEIQALEREMGLRGTTEARPRRGDEAEAIARGERPRGRGVIKPPIQEVFKRGDEVLVQVIKESIGTKGPTLSTYISIPGRYLVLMPGLNRFGVSRKIADEGQRRRLREIMQALDPPKGLGFIVRTAGLDRTKRELARDLAYLLRLWKVILRRIKKAKAPAPIYQESDMILRTIRDIFTAEIDTIWIDERAAYERAVEFMRVVMPKYVDRIKFYDERVPLFHKYGLEEEIARVQRRRVDLAGGGSIVIEPTEALVAIDVNSGNFRVEDDAERTAYEMNLRAAKEIARQLRLRDLGGVIINDFIDMRDEKHRRGVERALRDAVRRDRARTKILRMSQFGIIEMTRQRIRPSLKRSIYEDCAHCTGSGVVKTAESMAIDVMRLIALAAHRNDVRRINISVAGAVATYLNNRKRGEIARIEAESSLSVQIRHQEDAPAEHLQIDCFDAANSEIRLLPAPPPPPRRGR